MGLVPLLSAVLLILVVSDSPDRAIPWALPILILVVAGEAHHAGG